MIIFVSLVFVLTCFSQQRPKIGLVLGGGGAKGAAEVGALKVIERAGLHVDYIAGTSIGAIVGSLYAAGYTATELDSLFCQQEWLALLTDRRMDLSGEPYKRVNGVTYIFGFPVHDQDAPSWGVLRGSSIEQTVDSMLSLRNGVEFETLKIPFRCVAAELKTAQEVVLKDGAVPLAVRASMAIPGLFKAVVINGQSLIDGGMMNNLPVDVVRDMGADIVIAVDLQQSRHKTREKSSSPIIDLAGMMGLGDVADWVLSRPDIRKYNENIEAADVYVNPPLPDYEASSFGNASMRRMIDIGEQAMQEQWDKLMEIKRRQE